MKLTPKQAYVFSNLDRVTPWHYQTPRSSVRDRYKLDGWDCSDQIRSLRLKALVVQQPGGRVERVVDGDVR